MELEVGTSGGVGREGVAGTALGLERRTEFEIDETEFATQTCNPPPPEVIITLHDLS